MVKLHDWSLNLENFMVQNVKDNSKICGQSERIVVRVNPTTIHHNMTVLYFSKNKDLVFGNSLME